MIKTKDFCITPCIGNSAVVDFEQPIAKAVAAEIKGMIGIAGTYNVQRHDFLLEKAQMRSWEELVPGIQASVKRCQFKRGL